ncbi:MAG TPA: hypothetical protein VK801_10965 [Caulobacteraceae bacterium]|jgi:hypothetical protein|nr:hypothetical protein [Caulobacteraceae bacterium]
MRRETAICVALPAVAAAALAGCASGVGQGAASYDALARATKDCQERGGQLQLRSGYDDQELSSYDCVGARR